MNKKAQQEIAGFVLIVVVVMVGLVVYLGITLRSSTENYGSSEVESILNALLKQTTECARYSVNYEDFWGLFRSAHRGDVCRNLNNKPAKEYLNESLREVLSSAFSTEATISGYELRFYIEEPPESILQVKSGNVTRIRESAIRKIPSGSDRSLVVELRIYKKF